MHVFRLLPTWCVSAYLHRCILQSYCLLRWNIQLCQISICNTMSPRPKKARDSKSKVKVILLSFFDMRDIVHSELLLKDQTINQEVYKETLGRIFRLVCEKRHKLLQDKSWLLHQDNAPAHNALNIWQFLAGSNIALLENFPIHPNSLRLFFFSLSSYRCSKPSFVAFSTSRETSPSVLANSRLWQYAGCPQTDATH